MRAIRNLLTTFIFAGWILTIAVFSIQNRKPVSLIFFQRETIEVPIGIWLTLSLCTGIIGSVIVTIIFPSPKTKKLPSSPRKKYRAPIEEDINYQREIDEDDPLTGDWGEDSRRDW